MSLNFTTIHILSIEVCLLCFVYLHIHNHFIHFVYAPIPGMNSSFIIVSLRFLSEMHMWNIWMCNSEVWKWGRACAQLWMQSHEPLSHMELGEWANVALKPKRQKRELFVCIAYLSHGSCLCIKCTARTALQQFPFRLRFYFRIFEWNRENISYYFKVFMCASHDRAPRLPIVIVLVRFFLVILCSCIIINKRTICISFTNTLTHTQNCAHFPPMQMHLSEKTHRCTGCNVICLNVLYYFNETQHYRAFEYSTRAPII